MGRRQTKNASPDGEELRCECGALLARLVGDRVELKCRKCKRVVAIATITRVVPGHVHETLGDLETLIQ